MRCGNCGRSISCSHRGIGNSGGDRTSQSPVNSAGQVAFGAGGAELVEHGAVMVFVFTPGGGTELDEHEEIVLVLTQPLLQLSATSPTGMQLGSPWRNFE